MTYTIHQDPVTGTWKAHHDGMLFALYGRYCDLMYALKHREL